MIEKQRTARRQFTTRSDFVNGCKAALATHSIKANVLDLDFGDVEDRMAKAERHALTELAHTTYLSVRESAIRETVNEEDNKKSKGDKDTKLFNKLDERIPNERFDAAVDARVKHVLKKKEETVEGHVVDTTSAYLQPPMNNDGYSSLVEPAKNSKTANPPIRKGGKNNNAEKGKGKGTKGAKGNGKEKGKDKGKDFGKKNKKGKGRGKTDQKGGKKGSAAGKGDVKGRKPAGKAGRK